MTRPTSSATSGRSLELYFIDGKPDGMLTAEVFNWTGHVLMTPRTQITKALSREEAKRTGIYVLFGERDDGPLVYIGEAEEIGRRLRNHVDRKEWWTSAVLVTAAGNKLNKAHVKYLEARLVEIAKEVGNMPLENGNTPVPASLSEANRSNMETFLKTLLMVLPKVLPAPQIDMFLDKRRASKGSTETSTLPVSPTFELVTRKRDIQATAVLEDGEFIVQQGSCARAEWGSSTHWHACYRELHEELVATGVLKLEGDHRVFETNYAFSSVTAAGSVVNGRATSGPKAWKVKGTDKTYKDWEAEQLDAEST